MLGPNVVYVTGRGDDRHGGVYHRPGAGTDRSFSTVCGVALTHATLMQAEWAGHTGAQRCEGCYSSAVYGVCEWCGGPRRVGDDGAVLRLVCTRCGREAD